jgi:hypothetical protein
LKPVASESTRIHGSYTSLDIAQNEVAQQRIVDDPTTAVNANILKDAGFVTIGEWSLKSDGIQLDGSVPTRPGVYAHVVDGNIVYIGVATMGLKKRLYFYSNPGKSQTTSIRLKKLIRTELETGRRVEVLAASPEPGTWNGLPVDFVTGLETGLIRMLQPEWNKKGVR